MTGPVRVPVPVDEPARLARLHALAVQGSAPEAMFDALARAASAVCGVPIAMLNLVDADRQWTKAITGLPGMADLPRGTAFCAHTLYSDGVFEIADLQQDARFAANPLVTGDPHVRFYAGAPITLSDGLTMGALCVVDSQPHRLDAAQRASLLELAQVAAEALEMRERALRSVDAAAAGQRRLQHLYDTTPAMLYCADAESRILTVSDAWLARLGYRRDEVLGRRSIDFLSTASRAHALQVALPAFMREGRCEQVEFELLRRDGGTMAVLLSAILERDASGAPLRSMAVLEDLTERRAAERERGASEARYRALVEDQTEVVSLCMPDGRLTFVNAAYARLFGMTPQAMIGTSLFDHVADAERAAVAEHLQKVCRQGGAVEGENRMRSVGDNGEPEARWFAWTNRALNDDAGRVTAIHSVGRDITQRKDVERRLAESRELLQVTLDSIGDAVVTTDAQGRVQWLNPVGERLTGWRKADALGQPLAEVFNVVEEDSRQPARNPVALCLARGSAVGRSNDTVLISRHGAEYGITDSAAPIRDAQGAVLGAVLVFHDATEQRSMSREMSHRARHDALTGLVNRAEFELRLTRLLAQACAEGGDAGDAGDNALLYIDLDQFKLVNDACGHSVGDQLLRQVSALLEDCVRSRDTVARLGGDEFGILLEHCPVGDAQRVAQDICNRMEAFRFPHEGRRFRVGASIGLVPLDSRTGTTTAAVLQAADTSCYAAKEAGRNRVHTWFDTDQALRARHGEMQWATRIEQALDEDRFVLFAQRIEPTTLPSTGPSGRLHCELLLRMREAGGVLVQPNAFLPAAERFHLASRIDRWVARHAFEWLQRIGDAAERIELIAINLSGQSIGDGAFRRDIALWLRAATFDVRKLCFEITETAAITNFAEARVFIEDMRAIGVKIALDDFGSGASSFGYLKTLPVDFLKIDGQFITDLLEDPLDNAAVQCFVDVARVVGVKTIAEFVERADVLQALQRIGVDYAQGFLVHRPQPLEQMFEDHTHLPPSTSMHAPVMNSASSLAR